MIQIKKLIVYASAHISLSMVWLFFLELTFRIKKIFASIANLSFVDLRPNVNTFAAILFALTFFYTLKVHTVSIENLANAQGVLFSDEAKALSPQDLAIVYTMVAVSAVMMAFLRGPLVFVGYFMAFISYIVFISF